MENKTIKTNLTKKEIIELMRSWYMPNYFDVDMCHYNEWNEEEIYSAFLNELDTFGEELIEELEKRAK